MNVDLTQTPNNIHYKRCETTYNEKLKEMLDSGQVSLRGLRNNAKLFDELIFDINKEKLDTSLEEQRKEDVSNKKLLSQYEKRVTEIDNLIQHIYEDNISGKITDERFATLSLNYEKEQKDL